MYLCVLFFWIHCFSGALNKTSFVSFCASDPCDLGPRIIAQPQKNVKGHGIKLWGISQISTTPLIDNLDEICYHHKVIIEDLDEACHDIIMSHKSCINNPHESLTYVWFCVIITQSARGSHGISLRSRTQTTLPCYPWHGGAWWLWSAPDWLE